MKIDNRNIVLLIAIYLMILGFISFYIVFVLHHHGIFVAFFLLVTGTTIFVAGLVVWGWTYYQPLHRSVYLFLAGLVFILSWKASIPVVGDVFGGESSANAAEIPWWNTWWYEGIGWVGGLGLVAWALATWPKSPHRRR